MHSRNRFQYEVATGRATLPVVSFITFFVWLASALPQWEHLGSMLCAGLGAYLLIETNTRFVLIRNRTTLPSSLFLLFYGALTFLHPWSVGCLLPVCFICMLYSLFHSYESAYASTTIFHAFLWLGAGSLIAPVFAWFIPFLYIHMIGLRSFSLRTFFAGIIGFTLPYWFLSGYSLYAGKEEMLLTALQRLFVLTPFQYHTLGLTEWVSWGVILLLSLVYGMLYLQTAYKDKVQTRIMLKCMGMMGVWIHLFIVIQPHLLTTLLPLALIPFALTGAHLFALSFNRLTRILFTATLLIWGALLIFNLWTHSFNF